MKTNFFVHDLNVKKKSENLCGRRTLNHLRKKSKKQAIFYDFAID